SCRRRITAAASFGTALLILQSSLPQKGKKEPRKGTARGSTHHLCLLCFFVVLLVLFCGLRPPESFAVAGSPRHAAHVITAFFPKSRLVLFEKPHAFHPLRRLPRVELRDDQTHWPAMLGFDWGTVMRPRKQRVLFQEIFDGNVGGPAVVVRQRQHKLCFRLDTHELCDLARRDAAPNIIQTRPARDAMH